MLRVAAALPLVLGLTAGAGFADVTAEDIWQDWQSQFAGFGYEVTGTPQRAVDGLSIRDLGLAQELPEGGGRTELRLGRIDLIERGDGTVSIVYPESLPMALALTPETGQAVTAVLTMRHAGLEIIASGVPEALRYVYAADDLRLDLGEVTVDGAPLAGLVAGLRMAGLAGASLSERDTQARQVAQALTAGTTSYEFRFDDPAEGTALDYAGEVQSLGYDGRMRLPDGTDLNDMAAALAAGLTLDGTVSFGAGEGRFSVTEAGETSRGTSRSARTDLEARLSPDGLEYGLRAEALQAKIEADSLPVPVGYELARLAARLALPLAQSEALQDFGLKLDLEGLALTETLWAMIDPEATLPHAPADLALDLSGKGRLTVDIFDAEKMAALTESGAAPGVIERLDLDRLLVSLAGAKLTGAGGVSLDPPVGNEMPPAEGALDLRLEGGNALLDKLIGMGLVPEDQAMMVRMMAGMFARPVEGEDTLTSRIEVKKDGSITVNGQRLR